MVVVFLASTFMAARDKHLDALVQCRLMYAQMLAGFTDSPPSAVWLRVRGFMEMGCS
jgi:hypothetical protein